MHDAKIYEKNLRKSVRIGIKDALNNLLLSKGTKDIYTRKMLLRFWHDWLFSEAELLQTGAIFACKRMTIFL